MVFNLKKYKLKFYLFFIRYYIKYIKIVAIINE